MTPFELVSVIEDADARARPGRRRIILELAVPQVRMLGHEWKGKYLGADPGGPVFGYTRRQCFEMREVIYAAARADLEAGEE